MRDEEIVDVRNRTELSVDERSINKKSPFKYWKLERACLTRFPSYVLINAFYSLRKLFTGFIRAALMAWKLTVNKVISKAPAPDAAKIHHEISVR